MGWRQRSCHLSKSMGEAHTADFPSFISSIIKKQFINLQRTKRQITLFKNSNPACFILISSDCLGVNSVVLVMLFKLIILYTVYNMDFQFSLEKLLIVICRNNSSKYAMIFMSKHFTSNKYL